MSVAIQVARTGAECWTVTKVERVDGVYVYETLARVIRDGGFYYVEWVEWKEESHTWRRESRGYLIPRPALKVAAKGPQPKEVQ